jgi:hypothetical protein
MDIELVGERPFIICDCDGCEKVIFNRKNLKEFRKATLLIELHGHHDVRNSTHVLSLFSKSHIINLIQNEQKSVDKYPELRQLSIKDAEIALSEFRAGFTEWVFLTPKIFE